MKASPASDLAHLATELRRQRQALRLTLAEVAERAEVSVGFLSMLERGRRAPSFDRLERVRAALGLSATGLTSSEPRPGLREPADSVEVIGARLAAGPASLADLARITSGSVGAVQEALEHLSARLQGTGIEVTRDAMEACLTPRPDLPREVLPSSTSETLKPLSTDQYLAIAVAAEYGAVTRRQLDEIRGTDSHELLVGLVELGFLSSVIDTAAPGRPRVYRLTTKVLVAMGVASVEALRASLATVAMPGP